MHYGSNSESSPTKRDFFDDDMGQVEASGRSLSVAVPHFPMIFSPISLRVFVFPSEGVLAASSLSSHHEDSLGPVLPSISTGKPFDSDKVPPGVTLTAQFLYHLANKVMIMHRDYSHVTFVCSLKAYTLLIPILHCKNVRIWT